MCLCFVSNSYPLLLPSFCGILNHCTMTATHVDSWWLLGFFFLLRVARREKNQSSITQKPATTTTY